VFYHYRCYQFAFRLRLLQFVHFCIWPRVLIILCEVRFASLISVSPHQYVLGVLLLLTGLFDCCECYLYYLE
jgi:hypothetical protein